MIHEAFTTGTVMQRYYAIMCPERNYTQGQAQRQSKQDKKIDRKILRSVIDQIYKEQKEMLRKSPD